MAEAEEVVTDVARHTTIFVRDLWRRYGRAGTASAPLTLADVSQRLGLLVYSVFGTWYDMRPAQAPAPRTLLQSLFGGRRGPALDRPVPATDGRLLWLPPVLDVPDHGVALLCYRAMALQQAMRAVRGSAGASAEVMDGSAAGGVDGVAADVYLLLEAVSADEDLVRLLPGMAQPLNTLRRRALELRPPLAAFPPRARALEAFARRLLASDCGSAPCRELYAAAPLESRTRALRLAREFEPAGRHTQSLLLKDCWTGDLLPPEPVATGEVTGHAGLADDATRMPSAGRLPRRPRVRRPQPEDEADAREAGTWMMQADEPHEKAEDPMGVQRPVDRDEHAETEALGDMLGELPEAQLVRSPGTPKEVLLSDDPPPASPRDRAEAAMAAESLFTYPEWDYGRAAYRFPGATVHLLPPQTGTRAWVDRTLAEHRPMLEAIRRQFEMLRAQRRVLKRQTDGDEIDLDACIDALADLRAGTRLSENLYQRCPPAQRDIAIMLLVDVSGSTDGWVASHRRIIDVEREALLLVCIALRALGEPYAVRAFSGEGPDHVTVRPIMQFGETYGDETALRIAALEPEQYTRAGAAVRHVSAELMQQDARHRLLLMLSDGKPNDVDRYDGRYGIEDLRQAVAEAR
ncbi:MAG TPA: hypothetical protein VFY03_04065, partial [Woeseiaceae bacterium]|nr:hypothetical protein [Woeseiaceae bacterium]